ncbi:MAG TPA: hypothetical protein VEH30_04420 [Terriglobales bacterium]|nr:hypothetical protein [Terriglobales bacterium]
MIWALLLATKPAALLCLLSVLVAPLSASDSNNSSLSTSPQVGFSADDFDWRQMVPYLSVAAALPGEQGIKAILENSRVLRVYVANDVRTECARNKAQCPGESSMYGEVTRRIDEIVQEEIFRKNKSAIVDHPLTRRPFPFSEIAVVKSEKRQDAYLILALADRSYTAAQVEAKYGAPYDTDIFQWYSVFKYRLDSARYSSKAVFEVDPVDGAVMKVAISLKSKKRR